MPMKGRCGPSGLRSGRRSGRSTHTHGPTRRAPFEDSSKKSRPPLEIRPPLFALDYGGTADSAAPAERRHAWAWGRGTLAGQAGIVVVTSELPIALSSGTSLAGG